MAVALACGLLSESRSIQMQALSLTPSQAQLFNCVSTLYESPTVCEWYPTNALARCTDDLDHIAVFEFVAI